MDNNIYLYVAKSGNDSNNGSEKAPFLTVERAVEEIKIIKENGTTAPVTVIIAEGNYSVDGIVLSSIHSGSKDAPVLFTAAEGAEVSVSGGRRLDMSGFEPVKGEAKERFKPEAREHIYQFDLKTIGITGKEIGPVYSPDGTASKYPGDTVGKNFELFWNKKRLALARYPNEGFLEIEEVVDYGVCKKHPDGSYNPKWAEPAPRGGTIQVDDATAEEMKLWKEPITAWSNGYYFIDWVNTSTPIDAISLENKTVKFGFSTPYGYRKGGTYYFYNILEELDMPGEYFIDRDNAILYVWPTDAIEKSTAAVSVSRNPIISGEGVEYIEFRNISFGEVRNDGVNIKGSHLTFRDCTFTDISGYALKLYGEKNLIYGCEIAYTGEGGVIISGGDRETLTHSDNTVENCLIHDFAELARCYNGGVHAEGCGAIIRHNEFYNCPHLVVTFPGNDHLLEYNYLHEVVQESVDAGAFYTGLDGAAHGTVARYNLFVNVGNDKYAPCGIYWDDVFSGQTAYGNVFYNVKGKALMIGGGRDHVIKNNVAINSEYPILFDARMRDGVKKGGWFGDRSGWYMSTINTHKVTEEPWVSRFPHLKDCHSNHDNIEDINFCANPSYAVVENNVFVPYQEWGVFIDESVPVFGTVKNNLTYLDANECTTDGKYTLKDEVMALMPGFEPIPIDKIGRYK